MPPPYSSLEKHDIELYHPNEPLPYLVVRYLYLHYHFLYLYDLADFLLSQFVDALYNYYHSIWVQFLENVAFQT